MNREGKKEKRVARFIFAMAALLTFGFHALLLLLFAPPLKANVKTKSEHTKIVMLSMNSRNRSTNKNILKWMKYSNPTLIAKPSEKLGFSSFPRKKSFRKMRADMEYYEDYKSDNFTPGKYEPLSGADAGKMLHNHNIWGQLFFSVHPKIYTEAFPKLAEVYPLWTDSNGKELAQLFSDKQLESLLPEMTKLKPDSHTGIDLTFRGGSLLPRTEIVKSCGIPELDRAALRALMAHFNPNGGRSSSKTVIVRWNSGDGQ